MGEGWDQLKPYRPGPRQAVAEVPHLDRLYDIDVGSYIPVDDLLPEPEAVRFIVVDDVGDIEEFPYISEAEDYVKQEVRYHNGLNRCRVFHVTDEYHVEVKTTHDVTLKRG